MTALAVRPVDPPSRLMVLDALRGFSLGGILAVNLFIFAFPLQMSFGRPWVEWGDPWIYGTMAFLAQGKFYALFSLLFGAGFMLQREHLTFQGDESLSVPLRRLAGLLGPAHPVGILGWAIQFLAAPLLALGMASALLLLWSQGRAMGLARRLAPLRFRRFRIGPAEWLWRTLTYGRRQPFRV